MRSVGRWREGVVAMFLMRSLVAETAARRRDRLVLRAAAAELVAQTRAPKTVNTTQHNNLNTSRLLLSFQLRHVLQELPTQHNTTVTLNTSRLLLSFQLRHVLQELPTQHNTTT